MCMIPEQCAECLDEISKKSEKVLEGIEHQFKHKLAAFDDKSTMHFAEQAIKYDKFENKVIDMIKYFMLGISAIILICASIVGATYLKVESKMDKKDAITKNEARALRELGDDYYRKIFVIKEYITADTSAYYYFKKNAYGDYSILRGLEINKN